VVYLTTLSVARGRMVDEYRIGKDVDGSGRGLTFAWRGNNTRAETLRIFGLRAEQ
jgi:hypothetical protein